MNIKWLVKKHIIRKIIAKRIKSIKNNAVKRQQALPLAKRIYALEQWFKQHDAQIVKVNRLVALKKPWKATIGKKVYTDLETLYLTAEANRETLGRLQKAQGDTTNG